MKSLRFSFMLMLIGIAIVFSQQFIPTNRPLIPLQDKHGNKLQLDMDSKTGSAGHVYGELPNIGIYGFQSKDLNQKSIDDLSKKLFADYDYILKIDATQAKLKKADTDGQWWFVSYGQSVNDVPVYRTEIGYTLNQKGDVIALGARAYQNISLSTSPKIAKLDAEATAKKAFAFDASSTEKECELVIYPKKEGAATNLYLTWKIMLQRYVPLQEIIYFVDAQNGTIIDQLNNIVDYQISGTISGKYWPVRNTDATISAGFNTTGINVFKQGQVIATVNSNGSGYYQTANNLPWYYLKDNIPLQNAWVTLTNNYTPVTYDIWTYPGSGKNCDWGATDASNVRWHAVKMHDYFKTNFNYLAMDYQMPAFVAMGSEINGKANGTMISFGSQNNQHWARSSGCIYHEYTHNVIYHIYGGWINDGSDESISMNEGLPDYFACTRINNPQVAPDCGLTRTLSNNNMPNWTLPQPDEWYYNGTVIGGACWDIRNDIGNTIADNLVFKALQMTPHAMTFTNFGEYVMSVDVNLYGSGHRLTIYNDFYTKHGIVVF